MVLEYVEKGFKHLSDHEMYSEFGQKTTMEVASKVTSAVTAMYQDAWLDKSTAEYLLTQDMYFLTKIYKNPHSERPIVSGCNGPTERVSA